MQSIIMSKVKVVKVSSNGTTSLVYIPKKFAKELEIKKGNYIKMILAGGQIIIQPLDLGYECGPGRVGRPSSRSEPANEG